MIIKLQARGLHQMLLLYSAVIFNRAISQWENLCSWYPHIHTSVKFSWQPLSIQKSPAQQLKQPTWIEAIDLIPYEAQLSVHV